MKSLSLQLLSLSLVTIATFGFSAAAIAQTTQTKTSQQQLQIAQAEETLVEVASNDEELSTLVSAVEAAGLVETLQGEGPFTVFAPTNEAFEALPEGVLEFLLEPENQDLLEQILTYHVVEGNVMSTDLEMGSIEALGGGIAIDVSEEDVKINNANVIQADVEASNGTAHVIDTVLAPEGFLQTIEERMN
ncbi:MAG: fasciclin domain-containing protein [Halothece sp.]